MREICLTDKMRDKTTKFEGKVTAIARYLTGPNRILLENVDNTGRPIEWWYDEDRLEFVYKEED